MIVIDARVKDYSQSSRLVMQGVPKLLHVQKT